MGTRIRRVRPEDWQAARRLRLDALRDEAAPIAFLEPYQRAALNPDEFWQARATAGAVGDDVAQFLADDDGALVGTVTVLVQVAGSHDYHGRPVDRLRAALVGVYVRPGHRGAGVIDGLIDAAARWCRERGITQLVLDVHQDNVRAQRAYRRAGFVPTGGTLTGPIGAEIDMARSLDDVAEPDASGLDAAVTPRPAPPPAGETRGAR